MKKSFFFPLALIIWGALFFATACGNEKHAQSSAAGESSTPPSPAPTPASPLPTPPSSAKVFTNIQQNANWSACDSSSCAGGSGAGSYWMAQNQATPSLSGRSMELYNSGVWANALWWQKLGANNSATNFLWDFYAQVDSVSASAAQALEFDAFQFVGGYNYMLGSQCDLAEGWWDLWDGLNGKWVRTSVPCKQFAPNTWHHIQWYVQRSTSSRKYTFVTLVVDGTAYTLNQSYSAPYLGWSDDVGVQYQLDVNASGAGYHEWVDKSTLTIW